MKGNAVEPWHEPTGWSAVPFVGWLLMTFRADGHTFMARTKEWFEYVAAVLVVVGAIAAAVTFAFGGIKFGNTIAVEQLDTKVTALQSTIETKVTAVQSTVNAVQATLSAMPRPSDYAGQQHHLEQLDTTAGALNDRTTRVEGRIDGVDRRVDDLKHMVDPLWQATQAPVRNPR